MEKGSQASGVQNLRILDRKILACSDLDVSTNDFIYEILSILSGHSGCDSISIYLAEENRTVVYEMSAGSSRSFRFEAVPPDSTGRQNPLLKEKQDYVRRKSPIENNETGSVGVFVLRRGNKNLGLLKCSSASSNFFSETVTEEFEHLAGSLSIALVNQKTRAALQERIKELSCLYSITKLTEQHHTSLDDILQGIVELIPPAWQYPDVTAARILIDDRSYGTDNCSSGIQSQSADIVINDVTRGEVEVVYFEQKPELDNGPFLREEWALIDAIAKQIAVILTRIESEKEKDDLQKQLMHADRLATIGQLSAGVAHELNEPLGNILGFAQLAKKNPGLPILAQQDLDKIVKASLSAREIILKLLLFARQTPLAKTKVNINDLVSDSLFLLEHRCIKEGIELKRFLADDLPDIVVDAGQISQVLVNLVVNAIQAMPSGGWLKIETRCRKNSVVLCVEDSGEGMSEDIIERIFLPFFTTKDVDQGTGLGLAVVHGIVTSHGGNIHVKSRKDRGSRFEISLPLNSASEKET